MYRSSAPVIAGAFHDRRAELERIGDALASLERGAPRWLAILGPRKIGKTSLILEAARRARGDVAIAVLDAFERMPLDLEVFRVLAVRALDALVGDESAGALRRRLHDPGAFRALLHTARSLRDLPAPLRTDLDRLVDEPATPDAVRRWLELPEELCAALDRKLVLAIDEVQELASLSSAKFEPFPLMRAVWQRHQHVAYFFSGSAPSMLRQLVSSRESPFFQHFTLFELAPFGSDDAISLLVDEAPPDRSIPRALAARLYEVVGGHPFYLQVLGESLTASPGPYELASLKPLLQSELFSRTGRLSLYFENEYRRIVGNATTAAASLEAIARHGPMRMTDVARAIGSSTAATARYLERLGDAVVRDEAGLYRIADPVFARWIEWRSPGGTVVPMKILGDEAELAVAEHLAGHGFDLVYQSRGSRGAFDLLALRGHQQLGVQVKRSAFPVRFGKREWARMDADATRWDWAWCVAVVDAEARVHLCDPRRAEVGREVRVTEKSAIDNVSRWLDRKR